MTHITAVEAFSLDVPLRRPVSASPAQQGSAPLRDSLPMLFVRVDAADGVSGWGEAFAYNLRDATRLVLDEVVIPRCIGRPSERIADVVGPIERELRNSKAGLLTFALSAIDIALWDIAGKRAGVPLGHLLGDGRRTAVPAYASLVRYGDPERAAAESAAVVARGYGQVKLHEVAYEPIAAVRRAVGDAVPLMVDASSAWSPADALAIAPRLAGLGVAWLEEPTWPPEDYEALARVAAEGGIPVAAGENATSLHDFRLLAGVPGVEVLQPSVCKLGGVTGTRAAMAIAAAAGRAAVPHVYFLGPGLLAALHLIASLSGAAADAVPVEHAIFDVEAEPYPGTMTLTAGALPVPAAPGLGADPDPAFVARYARPPSASRS